MAIQAGILGASGYTGAELLRLLAGHPHISVHTLSAHSFAGKKVSELYPHLSRYRDRVFLSTEAALEEITLCDLVFSALPHGESMSLLPRLKNKLIIDLASDFRLQNPADYVAWYGKAHSCPAELSSWVYGLPELFLEKISQSSRIANPGCYATAVTLAAAPLLALQLCSGTIRVSAASGVSGAGRAAKDSYHYPHLTENYFAYKIGAHQHTAEIEQSLSTVSGKPIQVSLTAHLLPIARGIFVTLFAECSSAAQGQNILKSFQDFYAGKPFIRVSETPLDVKQVRATNLCAIHPVYDSRTNTFLITAVLDNLAKGASGQAIQNANLALQLPETSGLDCEALYP